MINNLGRLLCGYPFDRIGTLQSNPVAADKAVHVAFASLYQAIAGQFSRLSTGSPFPTPQSISRHVWLSRQIARLNAITIFRTIFPEPES